MIEKVKKETVGEVLRLIRELAAYEHLEDQVDTSEEILYDSLFVKKTAEAVLYNVDGKYIGYALYFMNFSTFLGRAGIYWEDVYVSPDHRGKGCGMELLRYVAKTGVERGCKRMEWCCLDWNKPSYELYESLGAVPMTDWTLFRLTGEKLSSLAGE